MPYADPVRRKEYMAEYARKHPEKYRNAQARHRERHGLGLLEYQKHWYQAERERSAGRPRPVNCEVCGEPPRAKRGGSAVLCYDHDHVTGRFRGWLCFLCNAALGNARDNIEVLERLAAYLSRSRRPRVMFNNNPVE